MFWFNGAIQEQPVVSFDLTDRGLNLGDGVFDTSLARNGHIFRRKSHIDRMADAAEILGIPFDEMAAGTALDALAEAIGDGAVRLTLTRGPGPRGLSFPKNPAPLLYGAAAAMHMPLFPVLKLGTTSIRRNETSPASRIKALPYLDSVLALEQASARGADEVLFENTHSRVACLATANIFAIFGRQLVTPPLSDGALAGTTRAFVLSKAHGLHFDVAERSLPLEKFSRADALFATSSLRLIAPCSQLDAITYPSEANEIVMELQASIKEVIASECGRF
ncbi:MAG: aminotransferase class IV [Methylovirgula sp.]|uniref:aminotransferase class IV n=1 Tax=Methylovirgula sp. TaxID=1978224 RepID=UPI002EDE2C83